MVGLFCVLMTACGGKRDSSPETSGSADDTFDKTVSSTLEASAAEEQISELTTENLNNEWASAYEKYLLGKYKKAEQDVENGEYDYMPFSTFVLYYIEEDDVPEILVTDDGSHVGTATLVTYKNGLVKAYSGLGSSGVVYFREKENVIVGDYIGSGMHAITVYHLDNGSLVTDWESQKMDTTWFEDGGKIDYSTYGAVVDAKEYQAQYDQFVPKWYDPMNEGIDALPESKQDTDDYIELKPEEIEKFFNHWIEE